MLKLTGGKHRGKTLKFPKHLKMRPMAAVLREALFNHLVSVEDLDILDGFAGAGTLGLEALSRGAKHLTVLEIETSHLKCIAEQIGNLGYTKETKLLKRNVFRAFSYFVREQLKFDIIFFDPPYSFVQKELGSIQKLIENWKPVLKENGRLILGHPGNIQVNLGFDEFVVYSKVFGNRGIKVFDFG